MRTRIGTILIAVVALVVGVAAGWFAAGARGKNKCENVEVCKNGNVETANGGRAHSPSASNGRACRSAIVDAKPHQKSEAPSEKCREPEAAKPEEKPAQVAQPELQKDDNPFPLSLYKPNRNLVCYHPNTRKSLSAYATQRVLHWLLAGGGGSPT